MLTLQCPYCGARADETELAPGGEAHLQRHGPGSDEADFEAYLFLRENPRGVHFERWRHAYGCGKWFLVARDTTSNRVFGSYRAQSARPPQDILDAIRQSHPGFAWRDLVSPE
jgi:sarcosine oxidase subunit delta